MPEGAQTGLHTALSPGQRDLASEWAGREEVAGYSQPLQCFLHSILRVGVCRAGQTLVPSFFGKK